MRKFLTAAAIAAVALAATSASAATFIVTYTNPPAPVLIPPPGPGDSGNDFQAALNSLGLTHFVSAGANVTLSGFTGVRFHVMGSESGATNSFTAGSVNGTEMNENHFGLGFGGDNAPRFIGAQAFGPAFTASFKSGVDGGSDSIGAASGQFSIFLDPTKAVQTAPGVFVYTAETLYFGHDDNGANFDDNHDDFIVSAAAIPEPATWAMMIGGFGLVGASMRRRGSQRIVTA